MVHLDFKLLRSFAAVADELSVTRAAERLNLTQPTVSGQIKELEQTLGFLLFHRTSRMIRLSEQGEQLLPSVHSLLACADNVRLQAETMQQVAKTRFRLGAAMYTMDLQDRSDLLAAFAQARPNIGYTIVNRLQHDQVRDLLTDQLDAAVLLGIAADLPAARFMIEPPPGRIVNEVQYPSSLERVVLRRRRVGLLVPAGLELAGFEVIPRRVLAGQRIAMLGREHGEALIAPLEDFMRECGAEPVETAEGNALAVERHGLLNNICAVGIGWFNPPAGMVWREVEGLDVEMDFAIVLGANANRAAREFFAFARDWQAARGDQA